MKQFVIDTSVLMKLFLEEEDSGKAVAFFVHANDNNDALLIPALFQSEFLSVVKNQNISFESAYGLLEEYLATSMTQIDDSRAILNKALEITKHRYSKSGFPSVYDSIYHALTILNNCDFITADRRYYEKMAILSSWQIWRLPSGGGCVCMNWWQIVEYLIIGLVSFVLGRLASIVLYKICLFTLFRVIVGGVLLAIALVFLFHREWLAGGVILLCISEWIKRWYTYTLIRQSTIEG